MKDIYKLKIRVNYRIILLYLFFYLSIHIFIGVIPSLFCSQEYIDPLNEPSIPIYHSAKDIKNYVNEEEKVYSKSYYVTHDCPPNKLISFYDEELKRLNYNEHEKYLGKWMVFQDNSQKTLYYVHQFSKVWISNDNKQKAILLLRYKNKNKKNLYDKLYVTLQIMPVFNEKDLNEFLKEIEENGKFEEFMQLLKKYSNAKNSIDFDKAIDENPSNKYLQRYKKIIEDIAK